MHLVVVVEQQIVAMRNAYLRKGSEPGRGASCALACMTEE